MSNKRIIDIPDEKILDYAFIKCVSRYLLDVGVPEEVSVSFGFVCFDTNTKYDYELVIKRTSGGDTECQK